MKDITERLNEQVFERQSLGIGGGTDDEVMLEARAEIERLRLLINTPLVDDWLEGVRIEVAHQQHRWGVDHDAGKTAADWFWLVGYLSGKALFAAIAGDQDKARHHTISTGAALCNWWRHVKGDPGATMRPGIEQPAAT